MVFNAKTKKEALELIAGLGRLAGTKTTVKKELVIGTAASIGLAVGGCKATGFQVLFNSQLQDSAVYSSLTEEEKQKSTYKSI